jgi:phosphoribosylglycinamide formyltransferase-1
MSFSKLRILCLISGGGTTMKRVVESCASGEIFGEVVHVIANRGSAGGLKKAQEASVPTTVLKLKADFDGDRDLFGENIVKVARSVGADFIAQLGWLALTPPNVISAYKNMIINQHPGPLDPGRLGFGGEQMHGTTVHAAVLNFSRLVARPFPTEATVHRVAEKYDEGPLLATTILKTQEDDTPARLANRLLAFEHDIVVETIQRFACWRVEEARRSKPLIWPGEESFHRQAVEAAKLQFPNG